MRLKILKDKMLMLRYENELCQRYLFLKLMPILAIYKNAVHREHSVVVKYLFCGEQRLNFLVSPFII